jgi:uncharacterized protein (TIGR02147 family)
MKQKLASSMWRIYLLNDLEARQRRNPQFSMRSYAVTLAMSPTHLSSILSGKRNVTAKTALHLAQTLGISMADGIAWMDTIAKNESRKNLRTLSDEQFHPISSWHFYAILSLANLKSNIADPAWISQKLGLSLSTAKEAFEKLLVEEYIEVVNFQFRQKSAYLRTKPDLPSLAVRNFHKRVMELAAKKIDAIPTDAKEFGSLALPIDPKKIMIAKKLIREFQENLRIEMSTGNLTEVYFLNMQFFPVT